MFLVSHLPSVFSWSPLLLSRPQQQGLPRQVSLAAAPRSPGHKPSYTPNILSEIVSKSIHYFNKIFATNSKKRLFRYEYFSLIDLSPSFNPSLLLRFGHAFRIVPHCQVFWTCFASHHNLKWIIASSTYVGGNVEAEMNRCCCIWWLRRKALLPPSLSQPTY